MCEPISAMSTASMVMMGMSAASTVVGVIAQSQQSSAQQDAINADYAQRMDTYQLQQNQINGQAAAEMSERAREAMIERGRLHAVAAESGVTGISQDRLENESYFNQGSDIASIESNRRQAADQAYLNAKGIRAEATSRLNSIKQPSLLGAGLQIGAAYMGGVNETERTRAIGSLSKTGLGYGLNAGYGSI